MIGPLRLRSKLRDAVGLQIQRGRKFRQAGKAVHDEQRLQQHVIGRAEAASRRA